MDYTNKRCDVDLSYEKFPEGFMWCVATAAHQIEGAAKTYGKGLSIWNEFESVAGNIADGSNADIACDSYHLYREDISAIKQLGLSYYRFSISWPRILPNGTTSLPNHEGIQYYNRLIDALIKENICPIVTLYHWDLPQSLQDEGGWANTNIVRHFANYARFCYQLFGDRVKYWITINEPVCIAWLGHGLGQHAPGIKDSMKTAFLVAHHIILSHVEAWRTYDSEFRLKQNGKVGISINVEWGEPNDWFNPDDVEASERFMLLKMGWYADPIFRTGDYPDILKAQYYQLSQLVEDRPALPTFTQQQIKDNRGSCDFFGLNHYTSRLVSKLTDASEASGEDEMVMEVKESVDPSWRLAGSSWLYEVPVGIRRLLNWIKYRYSSPQIFITENGTSDKEGEINDQFRVDYYKHYINQVLKAINEDGVNVIGYTAWSLLDNFEWERGYLERFGLFHIDFASPHRTRTPKKSARFYAEIVRNNGLVEEGIFSAIESRTEAKDYIDKAAKTSDRSSNLGGDTVGMSGKYEDEADSGNNAKIEKNKAVAVQNDAGQHPTSLHPLNKDEAVKDDSGLHSNAATNKKEEVNDRIPYVTALRDFIEDENSFKYKL